jgi:hypothetical protein
MCNDFHFATGRSQIMLLLVVLILLFALAVGGLPVWPYAATWDVGYWPSGLFGLLLVVLLVWALTAGPYRRGPLV